MHQDSTSLLRTNARRASTFLSGRDIQTWVFVSMMEHEKSSSSFASSQSSILPSKEDLISAISSCRLLMRSRTHPNTWWVVTSHRASWTLGPFPVDWTPPPSEGTGDCDTPLVAPNPQHCRIVCQLHGFPKLVGFESCILLSSFLELAFWLEQFRQSCFVVFSFHLWRWSSRCGPATRIGMSDGLGYLWRIKEWWSGFQSWAL